MKSKAAANTKAPGALSQTKPDLCSNKQNTPVDIMNILAGFFYALGELRQQFRHLN